MTSTAWRSAKTRNSVLEVMYASNELIIFDTETTGLKPDMDYIIEIGALKYRINEGSQLEEIGTLHQYIKPPFAISEKISKLTGITNDLLSDKPSYEEIFPDIKRFFSADNLAVAAYNTPFDMRFLKAMYRKCGETEIIPAIELDVLEMARDRVDPSEVENFKLGTIAQLFGMDEGVVFHNAMEDARVAKQLFDVFSLEYIKEHAERQNGGISREVPNIKSVNYWQNKRPGWNRIYVSTDLGSVYYCIRTKTWNAGGDGKLNLEMIDMEKLQLEAWKAVGVETQEEFAKFRGKLNLTA